MNVVPETSRTDDAARRVIDHAVICIAGDSGDGVQLTGTRLGIAAALGGADLATFPDFPSEIRAPKGSLGGVSSLQLQIAGRDIHTHGDAADCLVALNPAALRTALPRLKPEGLLIVDSNAFRPREIDKAGFADNPLTDGTLSDHHLFAHDLTAMTLDAAAAVPELAGLSKKDIERAKNFLALGLVLWLFGGTTADTEAWLDQKFRAVPDLALLNRTALQAGFAFGPEAAREGGFEPVSVAPAPLPPGRYRTVNGNDAMAYGLAAGALAHGLEPVYCSYPITPASTILHCLAKLSARVGVRTYQAEDEIAAVCAAIGASYAGQLGITGTSGPGMALKTEALGLAFAAELPLVVVNVQRGGPSTGLPTKTEQSDLFQAVMGRNADTPVPVLAARSAADAFDVGREAVDVAVRHMTPVIVLSDGYLANATEPWLIPDLGALERRPTRTDVLPDAFAPFARDPDTLARPWVAPGTPGGRHRLGGLEREDVSGNVSYEAENHARMTALRHDKIARIADVLPPQEIEAGDAFGAVALVGWGSTYGAIAEATAILCRDGHLVSHVHLRHLAPFPNNLGDLLEPFGRIVVPELNAGQLAALLRSHLLLPAESFAKVAGQPFTVTEIVDHVRAVLAGDWT